MSSAARPAGAERRANRDLALARFGARDEEIRDVRARDQQDKSHRHHQCQERGSKVADELDVERADFDTAFFVRGRIRLLEPSGGRAERIEIRAARNARLRLQRLGERRGGGLGLLDALGVVRLAQVWAGRAP